MTQEDQVSFRRALDLARRGFERETRQIEESERELEKSKSRLRHYRQTITALAPLCSESPELDKLGITESVRQVMDTATGTMKTPDVVAALDRMGFDIKAQENVNASVHSVLNRMAKAGTITRVDIKTPNGRIARWQGPKYDKNEDIPF